MRNVPQHFLGGRSRMLILISTFLFYRVLEDERDYTRDRVLGA